MYQLSIPEVIPKTLLVPPQLDILIQHLRFLRNPHYTQNHFTAECLEALLQMQMTDPFCKCISRRLLNGKAPHHEFDTFTHVKGLLYKHIMDTGKKFLALVIPKSWKYTVLMEVHDKLGHQGNSCTYCLIKPPILLERDEQGYLEIYYKLCSLLTGKSQSLTIPITDD